MADEPVLLLVEDDPADAKLIQRAIVKVEIPARVVHLPDGDEAVAYLSREGLYSDPAASPLPRLVILDVKLPRRSGMEVLQWVRQQPAPVGATPVVMLSSSNHSLDVNAAYAYGANSYLVKPATSQQLQSMMNVMKTYWFMHSQLPRWKQQTTS